MEGPGAGAGGGQALKLTAEDLKRLKLIDTVIPEPSWAAAHRDPAATIAAVGEAIEAALSPLVQLDGASLKARRREKFLEMGREVLT